MTALAATLVHFLWQGAIVALLLAAANLFLRRADSRYAAACAALAAMLALSAATYVALSRRAAPADSAENGRAAATPAAARLATNLQKAFPPMPVSTERAVVLLWLAGVAVLSARLTGGWAAAARLSRHGVTPPPDAWRVRIERLASNLGLARPVRLLASALVGAPAALGVLRPVILVPIGAFTALSTAELEAILAHELAHIRRHDFLANLLQSAAETLFFYHPAVWWVSHRIRVERENACDDLAVEASGDAAVYARALVGLEEARAALPRLVAASTGGSLFLRVRRLVMPLAVRPHRLPPSIAAVLALAALGLLGAAARMTPPPSPEAAVPAPKEPATAPRISPSQLIAFRIHGVTPELVEELRALGFRHASADDLVALRVHGVTPEFIRAMRAEGLDGDLDQFTAFRIHGVTPDFAREIHSLGYRSVSAEDFTAMRIHGVTPEYIRAINKKFGERLSIDDLVGARIHGMGGDTR